MLKELQGMIGFSYNIRLVKDHLYGDLNPETKKWSGIIRELVDKVQDDVFL